MTPSRRALAVAAALTAALAAGACENVGMHAGRLCVQPADFGTGTLAGACPPIAPSSTRANHRTPVAPTAISQPFRPGTDLPPAATGFRPDTPDRKSVV